MLVGGGESGGEERWFSFLSSFVEMSPVTPLRNTWIHVIMTLNSVGNVAQDHVSLLQGSLCCCCMFCSKLNLFTSKPNVVQCKQRQKEKERGVKGEKRIILIKWKSLANRQQSESVMYRRWGVYVAWFGVCECWLPSLNVIGGLVHILRIVWMLRIVCKRENKWKQLPVENIAVIDKWLEMPFPHWELIRTKKP